ncbi:MAG: hypothetical protein A2287_06845 [Candidatus Melainabacteria bacterium RIFOXYA12_FULL_32_12]|nr:MAG: hypothetical protein A2255_09160 [Candidatus Melainabacteria bacterium RIFOXYA2_FULL_32_9]OGI25319.1 MAG: hypothetical protein A2287_06845 [Candidatus Melainabacteria bacterium RIFOXYA12_FULL_32_12]
MSKVFDINSLQVLINKLATQDALEAALRVGLIIVVSLIIIKVAIVFAEKVRKIIESTSLINDDRLKLRTQTITRIINSFTVVFISLIAFMLILGELGLNLAPVIAGVGVLGLAVSFGAQNLVKDIITGFFILLEDQYGIGDIIKIDDHAGVVENMNLRTTVLRDLEGNVHIIPNGEVKKVIVMTKLWSRAVIDVKVFYKQDIQRVFSIISQEASNLANEWPDKIIEEPEILGVDSIDPNGLTIRLIIKTKTAQQWAVSREFKKRIIERFNQEGIDLPFFQSIGYVHN